MPANTDPYAPTPSTNPTGGGNSTARNGTNPDWAKSQGYLPNSIDKQLDYDESTQYHRSLLGSDRLAGELYQANGSAFNNIGSDRYYAGAANANGRGNDMVAAQQQAYIQMLQQQALGNGPSAAQGQLRAATDQNIASSAAMAASGRGPGAAGAGYQAANMAAGANQQAANQSAILRAQEQQSAQQMLGGALGQARGQNVAEQQQRDDLVKFYMGQGATADQANRQALMDLEKLRMQGSQAQETADNNAYYGQNGETGGQQALQTGTQIASAVGAAAAAL